MEVLEQDLVHLVTLSEDKDNRALEISLKEDIMEIIPSEVQLQAALLAVLEAWVVDMDLHHMVVLKEVSEEWEVGMELDSSLILLSVELSLKVILLLHKHNKMTMQNHKPLRAELINMELIHSSRMLHIRLLQ